MQFYLNQKYCQLFYIKLLVIIICHTGFAQSLEFHRYDSIPVYKSGRKLKMAWMGGLNSTMYSTIDLNYDGIDDLVAFDRVDDKVLTFINKGITDSISYDYAFEYERKFPGDLSSWLLLRDYNGDGNKDIFSKSLIWPAPRIYRNIGDQWQGLKFKEYIKDLYGYNGHPLLPVDSSDLYPLYVSSLDLPLIEDIDADGDLDIVTWGVLPRLLYYKNMSIERYGHIDTVDYLLKNRCWGHTYDYPSTITTFNLQLLDTCDPSQNVYLPEDNRGSRHGGGTLVGWKNSSGEVFDVVFGDGGAHNMVLGINGGVIANGNSSFVSQDTSFPSSNIPVDLVSEPGGYYLDVNNDSVKDLLISPYEPGIAENVSSSWCYQNMGTNSSPDFSLVQKDFIQYESIDHGSSSNIHFFDYNKDGLSDMIISSFGIYDKNIEDYVSSLSLYENIGTIQTPEFNHITNDYNLISTLNIGKSLYPDFADVDADGDADVIIGTDKGVLYLFLDTSGTGLANFQINSQPLLDFLGDTIDVGNFATPQLFDYDRDGDFDLVVGEKEGNINYYENIGDSANYSFQFISDSMGGVKIYDPVDTASIKTTGYSTPYFFIENNEAFMVSGSQFGEAYFFEQIDSLDPNKTFVLTDTIVEVNHIGKDITVSSHDIDLNGQIELYFGNRRGGVCNYFPGPSFVSLEEVKKEVEISIYPNPSSGVVHVKLPLAIEENINIKLLTLQGREVFTDDFASNAMFNFEGLNSGVYIVFITGKDFNTFKKLVIK